MRGILPPEMMGILGPGLADPRAPGSKPSFPGQDPVMNENEQPPDPTLDVPTFKPSSPQEEQYLNDYINAIKQEERRKGRNEEDWWRMQDEWTAKGQTYGISPDRARELQNNWNNTRPLGQPLY